MTFNGADKSNSLIADIDFLLWGTSAVFNTSYSLIDRTRNVNAVWDEAVETLYKADPENKWDDTTNTDFPIATTDLIASQPAYTLLDSMLIIHRVRVKDPQGNFITLNGKIRAEFNDDELAATGTPDSYFKTGGAIFPLPTPTYGFTDGFELEFQRGANHFSPDDTETGPGFNSQYHQFLSVGAALRYAMANDMAEKVQALTAEKMRIQQLMQEHYQLRSPDATPRMKLKRRSIRSYGLGW